MPAKQKYYVVWQGYKPGIYSSWPACQAQIDGFPGARYKSFESKAEAEAAFSKGPSQSSGKSASSPRKASGAPPSRATIIWDSIAVDAACSGNPGIMEYQGVKTQGGEQLFHQKFDLGTNNIGEFLAIVHGLAMLKKEGRTIPIYSDSATALKWVRDKKARTKLEHTPKTAYLYEVIERAEAWLKKNTYTNQLLKWETSAWGEIPADFGRKG